MKKISSFTEQAMIEGESPRPVLYKIIKVSGVIIILGILLDIWLDGFSFSILSKYMLPLVLVGYCSKVLGPSNKLIQVQNNLSVENNELVYEVEGINNENRKAIFPINTITSAQFKEKDRVIVIEGEPRIEVKNLKNGKVNINNCNGMKKSIDIKIGNTEKEKVLEDLKSALGCTIEEIY